MGAVKKLPIVGQVFKGLFNTNTPAVPASTASLSDPSVQARADEVAALAAKARGRQSTMLTGVLGLGGGGSTARRTLLGGGA